MMQWCRKLLATGTTETSYPTTFTSACFSITHGVLYTKGSASPITFTEIGLSKAKHVMTSLSTSNAMTGLFILTGV